MIDGNNVINHDDQDVDSRNVTAKQFLKELRKAKVDFSRILNDKLSPGILTSALMYDGIVECVLIRAEAFGLLSIKRDWLNDLNLFNSVSILSLRIVQAAFPEIFDSPRAIDRALYITRQSAFDRARDVAGDIISDRERALDKARDIARSKALDISIEISSAREIALDIANFAERRKDFEGAISNSVATNSVIGIGIAIDIAKSIALDKEREIGIYSNEVHNRTNCLFPILAYMAAFAYFDHNEKRTPIYWKNRAHDNERGLDIVKDVFKSQKARGMMKGLEIDAEKLSLMYLEVCYMNARICDMKNDLHFTMDCLKTMAWNPDLSSTNRGAIQDIAENVILQKSVSHSSAIMFLKELGMPGREEVYLKNKEAVKVVERKKPENYIGAVAKKQLEQIEAFNEIYENIFSTWGWTEEKLTDKK